MKRLNQSMILFYCLHGYCFVPVLQTSADACNSIITMYGNTDITPAVPGCHGNFVFC